MKKRFFTIIIFITAIMIFSTVYATSSVEIVLSPKSYNILEPLEFTVVINEEFDYADVYLNEEILNKILPNGGSIYPVVVDISGATKLGKSELKVIARRGNQAFSDSKEINLYLLGESRIVLEENFDRYPGTDISTGIFSFTSQGVSEPSFVRDENDKNALRITFTQSTTAGPFFMKNGLDLGDGIFEVSFDIMFSSLDESMNIQFRNRDGTHPTPSAAITIFSRNGNVYGNNEFKWKPNTLYSVRLIVDTIDGGAIYYINGDYIGKHETYKANGIDQVRFTINSSSATPGNWVQFDNVCMRARLLESRYYIKNNYICTDIPVDNSSFTLFFSEDMTGITQNDIRVFNSSGDPIPFTGKYNADDFSYTINFQKKLLHGMTYYVQPSETLVSKNQNKQLTAKTLTLITQKSDYGIAKFYIEGFDSLSSAAGEEKITVVIETYGSIPLEQTAYVIAGIYGKNKLESINVTKFSSDINQYKLELIVPDNISSEEHTLQCFLEVI